MHRDGHFTHEGEPIRHVRLRRLLERSVRFSDADAAFVVQVGRFRGRIEIEATPFFVRMYDAASGTIELSDRTVEPLRPETLRVTSDSVFSCEVKQRFRARFEHAAQSSLLAAVSFEEERPYLEVAGRVVPLDPGLAI